MPYRNPPVTEALIDIQAMGIQCTLDQLRAIAGDSRDFPDIREIRHDQIRVMPGKDTPVSATQEVVGYQFWAGDKKRVWQARSNGFTLSHLAPYSTWESLVADARPLWTRFREATGGHPSRVAVRYINRFDIAAGGKINYEDYFRTVPKIPPELDTGLTGYLMQLVLPQQDLKAVAVITQTPSKAPDPNVFSLVLDIDLFREVEIPQDEEGLWALLEQFRERKNFIFENCMGDKAREVIG